MPDKAVQVPMNELVHMAARTMLLGARMRLDAIPGDASCSSSMISSAVVAEIGHRLIEWEREHGLKL